MSQPGGGFRFIPWSLRRITPHLEPVGAMFGRQPIVDRWFIEKAGHIFDLATWAMANELPISIGNHRGLENHMRFCHRLPISSYMLIRRSLRGGDDLTPYPPTMFAPRIRT
jgi:hypothetical protein